MNFNWKNLERNFFNDPNLWHRNLFIRNQQFDDLCIVSETITQWQ